MSNNSPKKVPPLDQSDMIRSSATNAEKKNKKKISSMMIQSILYIILFILYIFINNYT